MKQVIGNAWWVHGPLVFGPRAVAARFAKEFAAVAPMFARLRADQGNGLGPCVAEVLGAEVLVLPSHWPTRFKALAAGGVFVTAYVPLGTRKAEAFVVSVALAEPLVVGKDWVLFDSVAGAPAASKFEKLRALDRMPIAIAPGRYTVTSSAVEPNVEIEYYAVRLDRVEEGAAAKRPAMKSAAKRPAMKSAAKKPSAKQSSAKQSSAKQSSAKQSSAKQSSAKQSATTKRAARR